MTDTCDVLQVLADQALDKNNTVRIPFENTPTIEYYHNTVPRLTTNNNKDVLDISYVSGMIGFGAAYVGFFLIWALILGFFKWRGPEKKAGWLSGSRGTKSVPKKQSTCLRVIMYLTILGIIIANITLFFTGLKDLSVATEDGLATLDQAEAQMKLSVCLFDQAIDRVELAENNTQTLLDRANNICPRVQNQFCKVLSDPNSCDDDDNGRRRRNLLDPCKWISTVCDTVSDIYDDITGVIGRLMDGVKKGIEFFQEEDALKIKLQEIREDINGRIEQRLVQLKEQIETAVVMVDFSSAVCWLSTLVCIGLLTAHFLKKPRLIKIFFGLFLLMTIFMLVVGIANTLAAFAVSDLCIDDPDSRAIELLLMRLDLKSAVLQDIIKTFLENMAAGNCSEELPTQFFLDSIEFVQNGMDAFDGWSDFFWVSDRVQAAACGNDALSMKNLEEFMDNSVNAKLNSAAVYLEAGGRFFTCGFWMGLFERGLHQATCYDGMDALASVSLVQFIILCMSMLVVTFRVALWDILLEVDGGTKDQTNEGVN